MKQTRGLRIFREIHTPLVHLVGDHLKARVEQVDQKRSPDHVWIGMDPGISTWLMISVNTFSIRNDEAGFDPRVRVGIIRRTWEKLPERGINECHRFAYDDLDGIGGVDFFPDRKGFS